MNLRYRVTQLRKLSARTFSRVVARRLASRGRAAAERLLYTPDGPRRSPDARPIQRLGLLHADALSPAFGERFQEAFPEDHRRIIDAGRQARDLVVDLLGSGPVDLRAFRNRTDLRLYPNVSSSKAGELARGGLVPWHFDFKAGVGWPADQFFSDVSWGARGVDVKIPWELSRCRHFVTLGQAYALTGDESYTRAFSEQIEDWIRRNPPKHGVNWACAMDVALRACNWLLAWEFFERSPLVSEFVRTNLPASLWEHGRHIIDHLEWGGELSTNHYLSDLLGLAYIGRALEEQAWLDRAWSELSSEILTQTRSDGFDFEASTAYHRLVLEIFLFAGISAAPSGGADAGARLQAMQRVAGAEYVNRLRLMARSLAGLSDNHGRMPLIGDNDSGRVHAFLGRPDADVAHLCDIAALLLNDPALRVAGPGASETAWLFGLEASRGLAGVVAAERRGLELGESGIAAIRGPADMLVFAAQPNGTRGLGNHTHNDKLSFCLTVGRDEFLTDPGTFVYTPLPEERDAFRGTGAHTTLQVDGEEQNRIFPGRLFSLGDDAHARLTRFKTGVRVAGEHYGYARLPDPVVHRREIERIDGPLRWIIEDDVEGKEEHDLRWRFICGAGIEAVPGPAGTVRLIGSEGELELKAHPGPLKLAIETGRIAPAYGRTLVAPVVSVSWHGKLPFHATFTAVWTPLVPAETA